MRLARDAITISDIERLIEECGLDTRYLHADNAPAGAGRDRAVSD
jgi:hypothetical protein